MNSIPSGGMTADAVQELAPTGRLRAAINLGNAVLAQGTPQAPRGVTADLAHELGRRLGVPVDLVPFDAAGKTFDAMTAGGLDIGFLAVEPARSAELAFTAPYVIIEGVYMVPDNSPLKTLADIDRAGVRIAVSKGSAYDLYLTRSLKQAALVRAETGLDVFVSGKLEAAAGVKQVLVAYAANNSGVRLIDGRFMDIRQAICMRKGRDAGARALRAFVEEMKATGFVADALRRSHQPDAAVAPPAPD